MSKIWWSYNVNNRWKFTKKRNWIREPSIAHRFITLSQNVCLINKHILIYQHARCDCKLWHALWLYCVFWVFSYIIDEYSWLKYCISTKLTLTVYLIIAYMSKCQMWLQVMEHPLILLRFLGIFIHYWQPFMSEVLYLHQTFTDCMSNQYTHFDMLTCQK